MKSAKPIASLSLDLDNKWSYLKTHGDAGWETFPSYLSLLVPRILEFLAERKVTITVFVVGRDATLETNYSSLKAIARSGHEIGNHSFNHDQSLPLFSREEVEQEIVATEEQLIVVCGQRPVGFRGPGFSTSKLALEVLASRGYLYDASTLPTYFGPLARMYYFWSSNLDTDEKKRRSSLFGTVRDGFRPLKPYRWPAANDLLELPVTTCPIFRSPIHLSYLLYLSTFSISLALSYFRAAMALCRLTNVPPSLLLHSLDFLGKDDDIGMDFFPGMGAKASEKLKVVNEVLKIYCDSFHVVNLQEHAFQVLGQHCPLPRAS